MQNGPANKTDWIALYAAGGATYLDWKYLNGAQVAPASGLFDAVVPFAMPMTAGTYELKFFSGSTLLATTATITVTGPTLAVSTSTVIGGGTVTATVGNGPGLARDWVGVYSANGSTLFDWKYLNGSQTPRRRVSVPRPSISRCRRQPEPTRCGSTPTVRFSQARW